ncbi:L,D-transpeptidase family protein [Fundicoccus ignavus]|uniref:L,D-transpeptidase family protein n=1 Tax=Fundicoccus ignavus TaxID=2664442 RepID=UPI0020A63049
MKQAQEGSSWLASFFGRSVLGVEAEAGEVVSLDFEQAKQALGEFEGFWRERVASEDAEIVFVEGEGYQIQADRLGTRLDEERLQAQLLEVVEAGASMVDLSASYQTAEVTQADEALTERLDQIQAATSMSITLQIAGYEEVITPEMISSWLIIDEVTGELYFDETLIYEYLGSLNEAYATYDDYRYFESTLQGGVQLVPGTLGWSIDRESELAWILEDLYAGESVVREPMIVGSGYNGSLDDIGSSYIEVDILNQTMFVYLEGELVLSTPVVTGQIGTTTIPGAYSIWNMETPSELVGYNPRTERDYVQPVQYWMGFDDTGQGIHDANWQPYFGGDAYLTNGSLGCVNTPPDVMPLVFEYAYMGMPVIVFE